MKEKNENSIKLLIGKDAQEGKISSHHLKDEKINLFQKHKKTLIIGLMSIVCLGCLYLIFSPSQNKALLDENGLNGAVPQPTEAGMPVDKGKAYEQEMQALKNQEKENSLTTLSDYLNQESAYSLPKTIGEEENNQNLGKGLESSNLTSYRTMQSELGSFYQPNNTESTELRKQITVLKSQLADKEVPKPITMNDQIELMEKSYQLAAKYLPTSPQQLPIHNESESKYETESKSDTSTMLKQEKEYFVAVRPSKKNPVSSLFREPEAHHLLTESREFTTVGQHYEAEQAKNSIKACIHQTQIIKGETSVRLRLVESAQTSQHLIPKGTLITAKAKYQEGRIQLTVSSIELNGTIIPVELNSYDLDGQKGLKVLDSEEISALTEMAANMSKTSGTSIMLTQSTGQQLASDLSRGVVQGVSSYFSKKIKTPKITLKAGLQVLLVPKK